MAFWWRNCDSGTQVTVTVEAKLEGLNEGTNRQIIKSTRGSGHIWVYVDTFWTPVWLSCPTFLYSTRLIARCGLYFWFGVTLGSSRQCLPSRLDLFFSWVEYCSTAEHAGKAMSVSCLSPCWTTTIRIRHDREERKRIKKKTNMDAIINFLVFLIWHPIILSRFSKVSIWCNHFCVVYLCCS